MSAKDRSVHQLIRSLLVALGEDPDRVHALTIRPGEVVVERLHVVRTTFDDPQPPDQRPEP